MADPLASPAFCGGFCAFESEFCYAHGLVSNGLMTNKQTNTSEKKFGAFAGVFTPSVLTILGVIMYQRMGWLVGNAGLVGSLVIVALAHVISVTAGLSVASIATSRTVRTGGAYHIISRSLGLPIGGAIGLALFVAMSLAISLYLIGFAENFVRVVGLDQVWRSAGLEEHFSSTQVVAIVFCVLLTVVAFVSTSLAMRLQYVVLAAVAGSLVVFFLGRGESPPEQVALWPGEGAADLATAFAVYFPAVTGFTSGVAMAGDLKNPGRAIPVGTMAAILIAMVIYLIIPVFLAYQVSVGELRGDMNIWLDVAVWPPLVVAGIWGATLSSALASILGAPRVLQALANDRVAPKILGRGHGATNEPRLSMIVCSFIALGGIIIGDLDTVAPIISMFFLTCYGIICLACGLERWAGSPSFRPKFKVPAWISLIGAFACFAVMFKINMIAMIAALVIMAIVFIVLERRQLRLTSGDTWEGVWSELARRALIRLNRRRTDPRNWRPNVLVFAGTTTQRPHLIHLGEWIVRDCGLLTNHLLVEGDLASDRLRAAQMHDDVDGHLARDFPAVLLRHLVCDDIYHGVRSVAGASGLAGLLPNTVLLGWGRKTPDPVAYANLLRDLVLLDHNLLVLAHDEAKSFSGYERIDVWWGGRERNWQLMLLLASLIQSSESWERATVRLLVVVRTAEEKDGARRDLDRALADSKINAESQVFCCESPDQSPFEVIRRESAGAGLTMLGLKEPAEDEGEAFIERIDASIRGVGTVLLVRASSRFEGPRVLFEQGD